MTIGKRVGRHSTRHGWNAAGDDEWRYRKTLEKDDRDRFDDLARLDRGFIVAKWVSAGEPKEHDLALEAFDAASDADVEEMIDHGATFE